LFALKAGKATMPVRQYLADRETSLCAFLTAGVWSLAWASQGEIQQGKAGGEEKAESVGGGCKCVTVSCSFKQSASWYDIQHSSEPHFGEWSTHLGGVWGKVHLRICLWPTLSYLTPSVWMVELQSLVLAPDTQSPGPGLAINA